MDKTFRAVTFRIQVATYLTKLSLNNRKKSIWLNWNDISLRKIIDFTYLCATVCSNFDKVLAMFVLFHKRKLPIVEEFFKFMKNFTYYRTHVLECSAVENHNIKEIFKTFLKLSKINFKIHQVATTQDDSNVNNPPRRNLNQQAPNKVLQMTFK